MGRDDLDPHEHPKPRDRRREAPPCIPTLDELQQRDPWFWVHCCGPNCTHYAAMAFAPLIIRWGFGTSSDRLRNCARCSKCGHKGASLLAPSRNAIGEIRPFPALRAAILPARGRH
jgi:hypothetical protein